ncbi:MAG: TetR/AcrR family transcriptional regulator [Opitutales bacterium]
MKTLSREDWIDAYKEYVLEEGKEPASVYKFAKSLESEEAAFYEEFSSFSTLESAIWRGLLNDTLETLNADEDYAGYDARQKGLAFFYTFIEHAKKNRSLMLVKFPRGSCAFTSSALCSLREGYLEFADNLLVDGQNDGSVADRGRANEVYSKFSLGHFFFIIEGFLGDDSQAFERTDALIEKSVNLGFDMIGTQVIDSAIDFFKFVIGPIRK